MSEKDSLSPREQKRLADAQTPYLTFLPRQAEGFDPGLHTQTGILTDGGAQPRRWLEDFSLHLDTLGAEEAAFAIPDALAVEQMTRRLLRLPPARILPGEPASPLCFFAVLILALPWPS